MTSDRGRPSRRSAGAPHGDDRRPQDGSGRPVTQLDVARAAGVSRSVVSHVLNRNGRISEETRDRVLRIAQEMDYQPHAAASELASQHSRRVVVILPYLDNPFFDTLVRHLRHHCLKADHSLVVLASDLETGMERATLEEARRMRPTGLVLPGTRLEPEEIERLGRSLPVCLLDRGLSGSPVRTARMDEALAAELVVSHLHEQGHRHLAFLSPAAPMHEHLAAERAGACLQEARRRGMTAQEIQCTGGALMALETALEGHRRPVAVVAYNDVLAINIVAAAHHLGRRLGPDLAVASYDNTRLASRPEFGLTSVDQRPEQLARAAVELLIDGGTGQAPPTRTVRPNLVVRSSTNRPLKHLS
ncbi:LacI family DNA-binding transcriptional regulator [Actinomyces bowdenii]|uniref:LacI family DNA-binding transcriptional regulator n=1 Tax=Actinomyces bowdenii TaxID=131109 RepID=UPI001ABC6322|nr:LacI family DNA-binding transcriptional regulator [Actinomyces bowdenii]MBO3724855.1 LacI family DNA-binding transcriptional regulator [Actinomyces bowdenii]